MGKGNQHFVPRVYLKRWSPQGNNNVFYYKKPDLSIGQPRNVATILYGRHTYTITMDSYYVIDYMPEVKLDFSKQIADILKSYNVVAFCNGVCLDTEELLSASQNLSFLDNWEFRKSDNVNCTVPKKRAILENLKSIRSYRIETALDDFVEKKWNKILNDFISEIEVGYANRISDEDISVHASAIEGVIATLLLFMCRNPQFDCQGIFPSIESMLLSMLLKDVSNEAEKEEIHQYVKEQIRGAWLSQVYKALFNNDVGFFSEYFRKIKERCQVTIMRCPEDNGSFLTSDNPAFSFVSYATKANYNAIYFPLTPKYLLAIGRGKQYSLDKIDVKTVTNKGVKSFNKIILSKANESVVSNKKYLGIIL